ncbi:G-type lectin S-receptor-like serine/threonine-protein kinase At1g11330 [Coffea arabica]|uniref:G-type lectin S-receptor-like serine/threonine-protein kinase At1g11330 n=1 Tax=Coffea arabica TaxID=13443 RepID=A0A6P6U0Z2_COFAR
MVKAKTVDHIEMGSVNDQELPLFNLQAIETTTDQFAMQNKLGEAGFGPVYKGKLPQGQEIAVKRLSQRSGQGVKEFMNEVTLISKLQHRNLVRLLGCCIQGDEYILIYEYMPNRSLDSFMFDSTKRTLLDWTKRVSIIEGTAQGLLYLHRYSRLRIIHRDLKASNILLDSDMNPKISDFGMARIFGENETRSKTTKIAGTYGYMAPEYAMDGLFSEKSDVFSFGIIVVEIISGHRNMAFFESDSSLNLLGHASNLWKEEKPLELLDSAVANSSCSASEVVGCLQLGLLCVQDRAVDRPCMSDVISMLRNDTIVVPLPKEPAFLAQFTSDSIAARDKLWCKVYSKAAIPVYQLSKGVRLRFQRLWKEMILVHKSMQQRCCKTHFGCRKDMIFCVICLSISLHVHENHGRNNSTLHLLPFSSPAKSLSLLQNFTFPLLSMPSSDPVAALAAF